MSRALLICGATGKQGGAVIDQLLRQNADFEILAVTRNADSGSAQRLLKKSNQIKLVQGNMADPTALFKTAREVTKTPIWGVFSVQTPMGMNQGGGGELGQGKALVDAAVANKVSFFVYASVDRHGDDSLNNPTTIPHFMHKHQIEEHLISKSKESKMGWTILRPVAFMDNFTDNFPGRVFVTAWQMAIKGKPLQLIASSDIGFFGAQAFLKPEEYKERGISLAGDELTFDEMLAVFESTTGRRPAGTWKLLTWLFMALVKDFGYMFKWFHDVGYAADISKLKKEHPELKDLKTWLRTESDFRKHDE
ncbi:NmrA-like family domain-containing protein [Diaporthe amygdali]|uniref:NmrA-like family domain-containing protein n=1 Tax=Phomopsis amygdali TaxID=1214568 RepID=UPI0022FE9258|nr:NmrA-like family domain-containing protein [Diaporthe amygdali]KAJ0123625.1 NmrA-like family domain-containing protein [Diaporthe amygdali]